MSKKKLIISIILESVIIVGAIIGLFFTMYSDGAFMATTAFLYYTIQSNLVIAAAAIIFLVYHVIELKTGKDNMPNWLRTIKFSCTVAITLTFVVFSLLLTPEMIAQGNTAYFTSISNLTLHNLVPICAIIDYLVFDFKHKSTKYTFLWSAVMPLYYFAFAMILSFSGVTFGSGAKVPYFFLNYDKLGWLKIQGGNIGVIYWFVILCLAVLAMAWFFIWIKNKVAKKQLSK